MKKTFFVIALVISFTVFTNLGFSQNEKADPYIISVEPDSLAEKYDFTQTIFLTISVRSRFGSDPTEKAIQELQEKIIETCKINKMEGFILKDLVFLKPFDEGKLIGYGTMIRQKAKKEE